MKTVFRSLFITFEAISSALILLLFLFFRTECIKLLVAVTILTCAEESERTELLNKWIEIAIDTKTALGNLFGFCGIMLGLCLPQVKIVSRVSTNKFF